jgi:exopolyphosphatase/guanosine-5'-triphosphate,3'-diphosphate pyrophosphatase
MLKGTNQNPRLSVIPKEEFLEFVDSISHLTVDELVQKYSIPYSDAETLAPALLTYLQILKETKAGDIIVSNANIRAGILHDLAPSEEGNRLERLSPKILSAARNLGRKYQYDENHAERVREFSLRLFDELKTEYGMTETHRLYLEVAALLHDIGLFVSSRAHHKHSYYLVSSSELFGLRKRELEIIANIARYHRRALPQRTHIAFISLDRNERAIVSKLGAILRVANALDKDHLQQAVDLKITRESDQIVLTVQNLSELAMGRMSLASRGDLFTEVFGHKVILREADFTP